MTVAVVVSALLVAVAVHEAAHALALRTFGIPIHEAGLGLPFPPVLCFRWPGFTSTVSPWLLGAYVAPHPDFLKQIEALRFRDRAWYMNAGIVANAILGFAAFAVAALLVGRLWYALAAVVLGAVAWVGRRVIAAYVLPAAAVPALIFVVFRLGVVWSHGETGAGFNGLHRLVEPGAAGAIQFVGAISLSLAVLNALPLFGLDNGKVVDLLLHRWLPRWTVGAYRTTGLVAVGAMLLLAIGSDMWAAVKAVA